MKTSLLDVAKLVVDSGNSVNVTPGDYLIEVSILPFRILFDWLHACAGWQPARLSRHHECQQSRERLGAPNSAIIHTAL